MKPILLLLALTSPFAGAAEPAITAPSTPAAEKASAAVADKAQAAADAAQSADDKAAARAEMARLQNELGALSKRMSELSLKMSDSGPRLSALRYLGTPDRAMVGMVLAPDEGGVRVGGLTPDGPAARAGLKNGDVLTAINGKPLAGNNAEAVLDDARDRLHDLKEGQNVTFDYRRDGRNASLSVVATRREAANSYRLLADGNGDDSVPMEFDKNIQVIVRQARADAARAEAEARHVGVEAVRAQAQATRDQKRAESDAARAFRDASRARIEVRRSLDAMPWWGIQLTELNPDLGRYFGTDHGVLVLSTDGGALDGVKAGDVIQQIAGSAVDRPEEALRRLRDQPADSKIAMQVLRDRKPLTLSVNAPKYQSMFDIAPPPPPPPAPPPPPPAPTAPVPPAPVAPAATPSPASVAPVRSSAATAAVDVDSAVRATIAVVAAEPALQGRMVSPGVAAQGGAVGSPGLWAGKIVAVESSDAGTCYRVTATTIGQGGKPVRGDLRGPDFSACTSSVLDRKNYYAGRYATFLGTVTGPEEKRLGRAGRPTLAVTDAQSWNPIPDMPGPPSQPSNPIRN